MLIYLLVSILLFSVSLLSFSDRRELVYVVFLPVFILSVFIGFRVGVGPDYYEYEYVYTTTSSHSFEPLFSLFFNGFSSLSIPYYIFNFFISFMTLLLFTLVSSRHFSGNELILFVVSSVMILFLAFTSTIRQACTLPFLMYAIANVHRLPRFTVGVIIGSLFHSSSLFLIICYPFFLFFKDRFFSRKLIVMMVFITLTISMFTSPVLIVLNIISDLTGGFSVLNKIVMYMQGYEKQFSLVSILYRLFFFCIFLYYLDIINKNKFVFFSFLIYFILFLMFILFKDNAVFVNRFSLSYNVLIPLICVYIFSQCSSLIEKITVFSILIGFSLVTFLRLVAVQLRNGTELAFLPYHWILF